MKTRWITFKFLFIVTLVLIFPLAGSAGISGLEYVDSITDAAQAQFQLQPQEISLNENVTNLSNKGLSKIIAKAKRIQKDIMKWAQTLSVPMLMFSVLSGAGLIIIGFLVGLPAKKIGESIKRTGILLIVTGVIAWILMNYATQIKDVITRIVN